MAIAPSCSAGRDVAKRIVIVGAVGGMIAGMMMAMVEMLYGWAADSRTFWDAPMAIWSWVAGLEHFGDPGNHVGPILLGIGGHLMNSMMVGVMFAAMATGLVGLLRRRRGVGSLVFDVAPIMLGVAYALGLGAIMRYGILSLNQGEDDLFTKDLVSPQWVWWFSHAVLGMTAGLVFDSARRILPEERRIDRPREFARAA